MIPKSLLPHLAAPVIRTSATISPPAAHPSAIQASNMMGKGRGLMLGFASIEASNMMGGGHGLMLGFAEQHPE